MKHRKLRSLKWPLVLFILALALIVALLVLWNVVLAVDYQRIRDLAVRAEEAGGGAFHWTFIALGSFLFAAAIAVLSVLGAILIQEIRFSQRLSGFIAAFTHELNSPLASIKMFTQTLRRSDLPRLEQERFLDLILLDVERLRGQISNVLRAAQVDSPYGVPLAPATVDLRAWLRAYVEERVEAIARSEPGAELRLRLGGPDARVAIDRQAFRQVLDNLVDNALKFARPGHPAQIEVALRPGARAGEVALEVADDGRGLEAADLERVFDRFGRGQGSDEQERRLGVGLGLWIVRAIVKAHEGRVWAASPGLGRGVTMRIDLPAAVGEGGAAAADAAEAEPPAEQGSPTAAQPPRERPAGEASA